MFLSHYFVEQAGPKLLPNQKFVIAGGFSGSLQNQAIFTELNTHPQVGSSLTCNVDELDS